MVCCLHNGSIWHLYIDWKYLMNRLVCRSWFLCTEKCLKEGNIPLHPLVFVLFVTFHFFLHFCKTSCWCAWDPEVFLWWTSHEIRWTFSIWYYLVSNWQTWQQNRKGEEIYQTLLSFKEKEIFIDTTCTSKADKTKPCVEFKLLKKNSVACILSFYGVPWTGCNGP